MGKHLLITGKPGVGKTTLIQKIIETFNQSLKISGFWTLENRDKGRRIGFDIYTTDGKKGILARVDTTRSNYRVGKYRVHLNDLEDMAIPTLYAESELIIIDEIGKMEILSPEFRKAVLYALENQPRVLATIGYQQILFLKTIKERSDVETIELTTANRKSVFNTITAKLELKSLGDVD
ncbi:MAG: NTPase [Candidatus Hodarchaeota archaeon]